MRRRSFLISAAAGAIAIVLGSRALRAGEASGVYAWSRPIVCGGHGHVCAFDPASGEAAFGGDVWGYHATQDIFGQWLPTMMGQTGIEGIYARGLAYSLATPALVRPTRPRRTAAEPQW